MWHSAMSKIGKTKMFQFNLGQFLLKRDAHYITEILQTNVSQIARPHTMPGSHARFTYDCISTIRLACFLKLLNA